jgi:hypothetical protein
MFYSYCCSSEGKADVRHTAEKAGETGTVDYRWLRVGCAGYRKLLQKALRLWLEPASALHADYSAGWFADWSAGCPAEIFVSAFVAVEFGERFVVVVQMKASLGVVVVVAVIQWEYGFAHFADLTDLQIARNGLLNLPPEVWKQAKSAEKTPLLSRG